MLWLRLSRRWRSAASPLFVALVAVLGFSSLPRPVIQPDAESTPRTWRSSIGVRSARRRWAALGLPLGGVVADRFGLLATFYFSPRRSWSQTFRHRAHAG
jgi:hypothetical protein